MSESKEDFKENSNNSGDDKEVSEDIVEKLSNFLGPSHKKFRFDLIK